MTTETPIDPKPYWQALAFGGFLLLVSTAVLWFAREIDATDYGIQDPGPQALPVLLGYGLLIGGIFQTGIGIWNWWSQRSVSVQAPNAAPAHYGNVVITFAALGGAVALLPVLGFSVVIGLFAAGLTWRLGSRWEIALLSAILLAVAVKVVFESIFKVPLPTGEFGFPF